MLKIKLSKDEMCCSLKHPCHSTYSQYCHLSFQVWDACSDALISFDASKSLEDPLDMGYIVENSVVTEALKKQLKLLESRVKVTYGARLKSLKLPQSAWSEVNVLW